MDWLFFIQLTNYHHQSSLYPNSNVLLHVERFKIICLLCHLGGMADMADQHTMCKMTSTPQEKDIGVIFDNNLCTVQ